MVNQGTGPLPDDLGPCIETLKTMAAYGKMHNVAVTMENRGRREPALERHAIGLLSAR